MGDRKALLALLPEGRRFGWLFDALDVCGEELETAGLTKDMDLNTAALAPGEDLQLLHLDLYRHHCRELCQRWKDEERTPSGRRRTPAARRKKLRGTTRAEVLAGLVRASQAAPLNPTGAALYARLFAEVFPGQAGIAEGLGAERFPGQLDEELAALRAQERNRAGCD